MSEELSVRNICNFNAEELRSVVGPIRLQTQLKMAAISIQEIVIKWKVERCCKDTAVNVGVGVQITSASRVFLPIDEVCFPCCAIQCIQCCGALENDGKRSAIRDF